MKKVKMSSNSKMQKLTELAYLGLPRTSRGNPTKMNGHPPQGKGSIPPRWNIIIDSLDEGNPICDVSKYGTQNNKYPLKRT